MSVYNLSLDLISNDVIMDKVGSVEKDVEFNSTRGEEDIQRVALEVQSTILSTIDSEMLGNRELDKLYSQRELCFRQRNNIINNMLKRLFNRRNLKRIDSKLEDIDYKIYLFESSQTKELIKSSKQELIEGKSFLAEMKKKYGC